MEVYKHPLLNIMPFIFTPFSVVRLLSVLAVLTMASQPRNSSHRQHIISLVPIENESLLVGDEACSIALICDVLINSKSCGTLCSKLHELALSLEIPPDVLFTICQGNKTPCVMLFEILEAWRSKAPSNAKLNTLLDILESKELNDSADSLRKTFNLEQNQDEGLVTNQWQGSIWIIIWHGGMTRENIVPKTKNTSGS